MLIITVEADEVRSVEVDSDALKIETPAAVISFWGRAGALEEPLALDACPHLPR